MDINYLVFIQRGYSFSPIVHMPHCAGLFFVPAGTKDSIIPAAHLAVAWLGLSSRLFWDRILGIEIIARDSHTAHLYYWFREMSMYKDGVLPSPKSEWSVRSSGTHIYNVVLIGFFISCARACTVASEVSTEAQFFADCKLHIRTRLLASAFSNFWKTLE